MKLRLHDNAIRLRLNRSEVAQLGETGRVEESIEFEPNQRLSFALESSSEVPEIRTSYRDGRIKIVVPAKWAKQWVETESVDLTGARVLIEKDFQCLHGEDARDPGAYPNPISTKAPAS